MEEKCGTWKNLKKEYSSNNIVDIYSLLGKIPLCEESLDVMSNSARLYKNIDITEAMSFSHCLNIIKKKKDTSNLICEAENSYQKQYNKTVGPLTSEKSIPDGSITFLSDIIKSKNDDSIISDNEVNLLSVFRITKIREGNIFRKIQKLICVAYHEYNKQTSLFYERFPNKNIDNIILHYYIWIPDIMNVNKIKNIIKKVYRKISNLLPNFVNIQYNIFQTFGLEMKNLCWLISDNDLMYGSYYERSCKDKKLKNIQDIIKVLSMFFDKRITEIYFLDTFLNDIFYDDSFFYE